MAWRVAKSLEMLLAQVNALAPNRSKKSDGGIGNAAHASRASDHNPWVKEGKMGIVTARDYTHDPAGGFDAYQFAETLKASNDQRLKYVIANRRIWNPTINMAWRKYHGVNPHDKHTHVSVKAFKAYYDSTTPWDLGVPVTSQPVPMPQVTITPSATKPLLKKGSKGQEVRNLQSLLKIKVDGDFGPKTLAAVKDFQARSGLVADAVVGPLTWTALTTPATPGPPVAVTDDVSVSFAMKTFKSLGWSKLATAALVAGLMWESGGNSKNTIVWDAKGDKDASGVYRSRYAPQWNGPRITAYEAFATRRSKPFTDPDTQLVFIDHELATTERKAAGRLRAATTIEEANAAAITFWRPSIPHADRRLAIAKKLLA